MPIHKIAVISDTHGILRPEAAELLRSAELILHGGDVADQKTLDRLKECARVIAVRGNCDREWAEGLPQEIRLELYGKKIYMVHNKKQMTPNAEDADIIIYGHSHKYEERKEDGRLWLNPGSGGPRRFGRPATMAMLEIDGESGSLAVRRIGLLEGEAQDADSDCNCGFMDGNRWFRYRAAAIIVEDGYVLFAGNEKEDYLYSIGGAVHIGETAEEAVKREVLEETGVAYEIDHLAVIHENFFNENTGSLKGMDCHEIAMYFLMKPRGTRELNSDSYTMGVKETMHWIPIRELDQYKAFPSFMKAYLQSEHKGIEHIVTDERV